MFEEDEDNDGKQSEPSPRKKSTTSQAEVERLLIKWAQDVLEGYMIL